MSTNTPVYNASGMWQIWNWNDVYTGPTGTGQYVPKVGDEIHQIVGTTISRYVCTAIDFSTYIPTLKSLTEADYSTTTQPADVLFGATPETYRVLVDTSVSPSRLVVDSRLSIYATTAQACKIFLGTDISASGTVISAYYDSANTYSGENLPLDIVATTTLNNTGIKSVTPGWTSANLDDGEIVTAVIFDSSGTVLSYKELIVINTGFTKTINASSKVVVGIALESPFLSTTNSAVINFPVNLPLSSLNLVGVVNYNDGTSASYAVDGTKFSVAGIDSFSPTIPGQVCPLTLKYTLQAGEDAYGSNNSGSTPFVQNYTLQTVVDDGSYAVQLYCYPIWVSAASGYSLAWYMYDLDRSITYNVTGIVQIDTSNTAYNPLSYGSKQTLSVFVNLKSVNASYNDFVHTQNVDVILNSAGTYRPASGANNIWQVTQQAGQVPLFGKGVHAKFKQQSSSSFIVDLTGDFTTYADWLNAYYALTRPLFNTATETQAPTPTHFTMIAGGVSTTYSMTQWNSTIVVNQTLTNNSTIYLQFFQRTATQDLQLSIAGVPLWQTDGSGTYL